MLPRLPNRQTLVNPKICLFGSGRLRMLRQNADMKSSNRLKETRLAKKVTLEKLSEEVGYSVGFLSRLENGDRRLSVDHIRKIGNALGVPPESLLGSAKTPAFDHNGDAAPQPKEGIRELDSCAGLGAGQVPDFVYVKNEKGVTISDAFKPEPWILPMRFMRDGMRAKASNIIAVETIGDSMEPTIHNGDVVFVDTGNRRVGAGTLHAIRDVYGEIIIKRLDIFKDGDNFKVKIISDNKSAPDRVEHLSEIAIIGRVCGLFKLT